MIIETWLVIHLAAVHCPEDMQCGKVVDVYSGMTECQMVKARAEEFADQWLYDIYCLTRKQDKVRM